MAYFDAPYRPADLSLNADPVNNSCVGFWPLTDGSGSSAVDVSTGGNNGTQSGGVSWATSEIGTVASFDGVDDYIDIVGAPVNTITQPLTLSAWIYNDASGSGTNDLVALGKTTDVNPLGIIRFAYSTGQVSAVFRQQATASIISHTLSNPTGYWHHICVVATSSTSLELFVDGVSVATDTSTNYGTLSYDNLTIGALQRTTVANYSDGKVGNVRLWSRALSSTQVKQLYTRRWTGTNYDTEALWLSPPASPTLSTASEATAIMADIEGWWVMTDGSGTTLTDISGNGRDATLNGTNTWETETLGTVNRFDNDTTRGNNASTANVQLNLSTYTACFWVKHEELNSGTSNYGGGICLTQGSPLISDLEIYTNSMAWTGQYHQIVHNRSNGGTYDSHRFFASSGEKDADNNNWVFWAITYDGTNVRQYKNGVLDGTSGTVAAPTSTTGKKIALNQLRDSYGLTCSMQNTRLWSRALSDSEISLLYERPWIGAEYNETAPLYPPVPSSLTPLDSSSINTDLQGWWPLTETDDFASGAADISGNSYNLTKTGTVASEFSALGTVPLFDGSTGYLRRAQDLSSHTSGVGTISLWWRLDSTAANNPGDVLFYMGDESTAYTMLVIAGRIGGSLASASISFLTYASGSPQNLLGVYDNGAAWAFDDTWHHFCYVVNSSSNHMYIDGVEISQSYYPGYGSSSTGNVFLYDATNFDAIRVGSRSASSATSAYTQGNVSNVRLWSRALSSTEVADIFYSPWLGSAYPSTGGGTPSYFVAAQFNRLGIGPRFRRL